MQNPKLNEETEFDIRLSRPEDMKHLFGFIRDLAVFEKAEHELLISEEDLIRDGFSGQERFESMMCWVDDKPAGACLYYHRYSTWKGLSLYLEDLYILPEYRRMGIASSFMNLLINIALERGCGRFEWQVLDWNKDAISFYEKFGATLDPEWINGRLTPEQMRQLAAH